MQAIFRMRAWRSLAAAAGSMGLASLPLVLSSPSPSVALGILPTISPTSLAVQTSPASASVGGVQVGSTPSASVSGQAGPLNLSAGLNSASSPDPSADPSPVPSADPTATPTHGSGSSSGQQATASGGSGSTQSLTGATSPTRNAPGVAAKPASGPAVKAATSLLRKTGSAFRAMPAAALAVAGTTAILLLILFAWRRRREERQPAAVLPATAQLPRGGLLDRILEHERAAQHVAARSRVPPPPPLRRVGPPSVEETVSRLFDEQPDPQRVP